MFCQIGPKQHFTSLLTRSRSPPLESLKFRSHISAVDLMACFRLTSPTLQTIDVKGVGERTNITKQVCEALIVRDDGPDPRLCPKLKCNTLNRCGFEFTEAVVNDLLSSRRDVVQIRAAPRPKPFFSLGPEPKAIHELMGILGLKLYMDYWPYKNLGRQSRNASDEPHHIIEFVASYAVSLFRFAGSPSWRLVCKILGQLDIVAGVNNEIDLVLFLSNLG